MAHRIYSYRHEHAWRKLASVLERNEGNIAKTARQLGVTRKTVRKWGIDKGLIDPKTPAKPAPLPSQSVEAGSNVEVTDADDLSAFLSR